MLWISLLVLVLMSLFVVVPYLLVGPPAPLFSVRNHDAGVHELRAEIFDSKNNSVLDETYELSAGEEIYHAKPFRFLVPGLEGKNYTFKTLSRIPVTLVAGGMRHLNDPCMSIVSHKIYKYIYVNLGYYGIY
jgi:hypothetical protein